GCFFFFSSRRRHTRSKRDWSSDVCSSDLFCRGLPCKIYKIFKKGWMPMEFETFKKELLDHLRQILGEEKKICFQSVEKNNGIREEAVVILEEGARIAPTIYLREFFENWKWGR